jgi:inner membrane protein
MSPGAHLLISWIGTPGILRERRDRTLVALAGLAPDIDGLGIVIDKWSGTTDYYFRYHHVLGHCVLSAFVIATLASLLARSQRVAVWWLGFMVVHLHILCDLAGSRGPDGYQWPIYYLYPFSPDWGLAWQYQWQLSAWPNQLIILLLLLGNLYYAATKRITFIEVISGRLNDEAIAMFQRYVKKA